MHPRAWDLMLSLQGTWTHSAITVCVGHGTAIASPSGMITVSDDKLVLRSHNSHRSGM